MDLGLGSVNLWKLFTITMISDIGIIKIIIHVESHCCSIDCSFASWRSSPSSAVDFFRCWSVASVSHNPSLTQRCWDQISVSVAGLLLHAKISLDYYSLKILNACFLFAWLANNINNRLKRNVFEDLCIYCIYIYILNFFKWRNSMFK